MEAVAEGIYQRRGLLRPRKLHQTHFIKDNDGESMISRLFDKSMADVKKVEGLSKRATAKKCCFSKNELQQCIPEPIVKNMQIINENYQLIKALPKVSNFLFPRESFKNNRGICPPKLLLGAQQESVNDIINNKNCSFGRAQKLKKYELESGTTQSTSFQKEIMRLDKGVQVSPKDEELQKKKKNKRRSKLNRAKAVQETKVQSVDEQMIQSINQNQNNQQLIRNHIQESQNCQKQQQSFQQQLISQPQATTLEKGFHSDQSKDEQQTLQQDHMDSEMRVQQGRVRDPQRDKVFQMQSQSQRAESKYQAQSQDIFHLDQEEEKESSNSKLNINEQNNNPQSLKKSLNPFSATISGSNSTTSNQQTKIQKSQSLFPTSLFQKKNISNQLFKPSSSSNQQKVNNQQTKPSFSLSSSGWQTSCQELPNNPFASKWNQGQIQQFEQKHANSFSLFEGNPFSSLRNNSTNGAASGGQIFTTQNNNFNNQQANSFSFQSKQNNDPSNNFQSIPLSESSVFNRNFQLFEKKCDEENSFRPKFSFTDNMSHNRRPEKQEVSDDEDLFYDPEKNVQGKKRSWNRQRF